MLVVLVISLIPDSFAEADWENLKVDIDKSERISGKKLDVIIVDVDFKNNADEQIVIYQDHITLDDSQNREYLNSIYYELLKNRHQITEDDCPWGDSIELNPGETADSKFCFEIPKENLSFTLHIYQYDIDLCQNPSNDCQEKTIRFSLKDSESASLPSPPDLKPKTPQREPRGDIVIAQDSSVSGCQEDRSCYVPHRFDAGKGSTVTWDNMDSTGHTVTSGTPSHGPTSTFDSGVVLPGTLYSHKFEKDDVINYFCTIHPWMTGILNITRSGAVIGNDSVPKPANPSNDSTPPKMLQPVDLTVDAENQDGAKVTFDVLVIDETDQILRPSCNYSSDSLFPIGKTVVVCNAMDSAGNRASPVSFSVTVNPLEPQIPEWIKDVASFWCAGNIDDDSFVEGLQYLIDNNIIIVSASESAETDSSEIPEWVKNNACWWSDGLISGKDFASGIGYLITNNILKV